MLEIVAGLCLVAALFLLVLLSKIDLAHGILPNEMVFGLLCLGFVFHLSTLFAFLPPLKMLLGALTGAGILYLIRLAALRFYGEDALGLGDVKLLGAAGVWLGPYYVLIALIAGATAGIFHGLGVAALQFKNEGAWPDFETLSLPAGPGFAVGIALAAFLAFQNFPSLLLTGLAP